MVAPLRVAGGGGGMSKSPSASGIFFHGDGQSPALVSSLSGADQSGLAPSSGDMNRGVPISAANSTGPSVGASSLVTDANSALSNGPQLQRSTSINTESYMRLPASPMSFSSNNISGSPVMDGSSIVQQSSHHDQMKKQGASSVTSQPTAQEQPGNLLQAQKKPRIDMRQEDILQQQVIQQLLQRQDSMQLQGHSSPQLQAIIQQQRLTQSQRQQQQQIMQSLPQMQRAQIHQQQQQMRNNIQQQVIQQTFLEKRPTESGICARRLMQYIYHQRHRPQDNSILYWRKFVLEYFSPRARKRWCLSMYDNVGNHALGGFSRASADAWHCGICGSRSGKGFEATFEVLPRINQIKFDRGVIDELLFLDMPHEYRLPSGAMLLEYVKAVQETVYEQLRVVREGQLRIIFSPELKILSWEFCARRHEEFLPRRLLAPQVNQMLQIAQKANASVTETGSAGVSQPDLQANCNMFVTAGRQLARSLELQSLNDLGFSKRYVRVLQISEVVNSMKDLIDFSQENKIGPIESLKNYTQQAVAKFQMQKMQEMEQPPTAQGLPANQSTVNKILANHLSNNPVGSSVLNNNAQTAVLNSYQNLIRSSIIPNQKAVQPDASCSSAGSSQVLRVQFQGPMTPTLPSTTLNSFSGSTQQQPQSGSGFPPQGNVQPSQPSQHLQQHVIQQMLQDAMNNNKGVAQSMPNSIGNIAADVIVGGSSTGRLNAGPGRSMVGLGNGTPGISNPTPVLVPTQSNSFKSVGNSSAVSGNSFSSKQDLHQNLQLTELDHDLASFLDSDMFNGDPADYGWKK